jgi:hypothetical protein
VDLKLINEASNEVLKSKILSETVGNFASTLLVYEGNIHKCLGISFYWVVNAEPNFQLMANAGVYIYTVPRIWQISVSEEEEVPCIENFLEIEETSHHFHGLLENFPPRGLPPLYSQKSALFLGQCTFLGILEGVGGINGWALGYSE